MAILYIDNFRGFESTYIPLKDVNFFVGENSTGKTSILKLLGILSSQDFWRYNSFGDEDTALGSFSEIITSNSAKAHFEAAFIGKKIKDSAVTSAFKIRFIEKDSYPVPKEISYRDDTINLQVTVEGHILKYRYHWYENEQLGTDTIENFKLWVTDNGLKNYQFNRIALDLTSSLSILRQLQTAVQSERTSINHSEKKVQITIPYLLNGTAWFAPSIVAPLKVYNLVPLVFTSKGEHFASVLRDIIEGPEVRKILNRFGADSGLFEDINVKNLETISDDTFEIQITINENKLNIVNVGYGVSQILPFILEAIARQDYTLFVVQQPETHLHPKAQAAIGEFIYKSSHSDHQQFVIETHSDYIIDRYRLRLYKAFKKQQEHPAGQVVFFKRNNRGNNIYLIDINADGSYSNNQPDEFRDFFLAEQINLLKI